MKIPESERDHYEMAFSGHGRGLVINQVDGKFTERTMTPGELMAREPAMNIARQIHKLAYYAAFAYIKCWEIIAPILSDMTADRDCWKAGWRCFHCDQFFSDREAAADHFGVLIDGLAEDTACKLTAQEGGIVKMLREAQEELRRYHEEDNAMARTFYALGAEHNTALMREEEKGYARGLADGRTA